MIGNTHKKIYWLISILIGISLLLGACTPQAQTPTATETSPNLAPITREALVGAIWEWVGGREPMTAPPFGVPDPQKYTLTFNEDGSLFVQADCNTVLGSFEQNGDQLTISLGASTLAVCEVDSLSERFIATLGQATKAGSGFGNLVITLADDAGEMFFQRTGAPELATNLQPIAKEDMIDVLWQWTSLVETPPASDVGVGIPENYDLVFRADGTYSAKADCNRLNGTYVMNGSQLTINPGITSLADCGPESNYDQYVSLLWRVTGVGAREGLMVLLLDDGAAAMSFVNAGASPVATEIITITGDPVSVLGPPNGVENFDNTYNWANFDTACFTSRITGGQFVMTANGVPQFSCWELSWPLLENFYLETTMQMPTTCNPGDRFGFLFRAPDTNSGYLYGFSCDGQYNLAAWDGEETTILVPPTISADIQTAPGATNRMGLMAFGENISLYINGVFLQTVSDYGFLDAGKIGYFVRAATEDPFTVRYDQLRIWVLEDEFYPPTVNRPLPDVDLPSPPANAPLAEARVNVNVRTGPSVLFPVLGTAQTGDTGEVLGVSPDGYWFAVRAPTNRVVTGIAWVSAQFVNLTNPSGQALSVITPPLLPTTANFSTPPINVPQVVMREPATVRSGPTLEFPIMGIAPYGARAEVLGESQDGEWWAVRVPTSVSSTGSAWLLKVFTSAVNLTSVPVLGSPLLPNYITPAAPASGAPSLITLEPLNVRVGPGNEYFVLGAVARGTTLAVVGISQDRKNYIVNIPTSFDASGQGWVAAQYVTTQNIGNLPVIQPPPVR